MVKRSSENTFKIRKRVHRLLLRRNFDHQGLVHLNKHPIPPCPATALFFVMPFSDHHLEIIEDHRSVGAVVIVDVVGEIWNFDWMESISPETCSFWGTSAVQETFLSALNKADVITTAFKEFTDDLTTMTGDRVPVIHVPDMHDEENLNSLLEFGGNVTKVIEHAMERRKILNLPSTH